MDRPQTLHGQLYLVAYDRELHRFRFERDNRRDNGWLLGFALRAAMLTDLYLTGHLEDRQGTPHPTTAAPVDDPVLREALTRVTGRGWARLIADDERRARRLVRDQLEETGWLRVPRSRTFGILPTVRVGLCDEEAVGDLAGRVRQALRSALDDRPADPRSLAVGLLAVQAQMPVVSGFIENPGHRQQLREMISCAIEPISGLHQAIQNRLTDMRADMVGRG